MTYFSEIKVHLIVLTKDWKLWKNNSDDRRRRKNRNVCQHERVVLTHKTTINGDIIDGIKADIVLDANALGVDDVDGKRCHFEQLWCRFEDWESDNLFQR